MPAPLPPPPSIPVRLTLRPVAPTADERLWAWPAAADGAFWDWCRTADERLVRRLEVAAVGRDHERRVVVRPAAGRDGSARLGFGPGYRADPRVPGLFVPAGRELRPLLRPSEVRRLFDVRPDRVTWLEAGPAGIVAHAAPVAAFRPLTDLVRPTAPPAVSFAPTATADPFAFVGGWVEPVPDEGDAEPADPRPAGARRAAVVPPSAGSGWLARSLDRLAGRLRRPAPPPPPVPPPTPERVPVALPPRLVVRPPSADRQRLEAALIDADPDTPAADRARAWAELAKAYAAPRDATDAAVCWLNAVWESADPPADWLDRWVTAECRAAGLTDPADADAPPRVLAAVARRRPTPATAALLDRHADDLPARAEWLARLAHSDAVGGDPLGLARARDRLLARLRDRGPALDLDVPSFLRFHGAADPDRFPLARDWLVRCRKSILDWVRRAAPPGRLQWAGLDAEADMTPAYALLLLARGLAALGDRGRAKDWAARGRNALARPPGPGADPVVHALLADLFAARIRDAHEGRPPPPGLPPDLLRRYDRLHEFGRYAVDKLRRFCRGLEPADRVRDYGGKEFRDLWGPDRLGDRLAVVAGLADPVALRDEVGRLLAEPVAPADRPRVLVTLLDVHARLDGPTAGRLVGGVPDALAALAGPPRVRLIENAFAAVGRYELGSDGLRLAHTLTERAATDVELRSDVCRTAGPLSRSVRGPDAAALMAVLDPDRGDWPADAPLPPHRVGLAAGWFAAGDDEAAVRGLDAARHRLFVARDGDPRDRTELAVAYAEALGAAPPRLALGRLEELFQRLNGLAVTGSTNRYYTLQPLRLVDRVVGAVVPADAAPGPAARGWLADDEFRTAARIHRDMAAALRAEG